MREASWNARSGGEAADTMIAVHSSILLYYLMNYWSCDIEIKFFFVMYLFIFLFFLTPIMSSCAIRRIAYVFWLNLLKHQTWNKVSKNMSKIWNLQRVALQQPKITSFPTSNWWLFYMFFWRKINIFLVHYYERIAIMNDFKFWPARSVHNTEVLLYVFSFR